MKMNMLPRLEYTDFVTPIEKLENLSEELNGPKIYMKRDDLLGLTLGGNKTRKLEFTMADAKKNNADTIITCGAVQSNHCRLTLSAAIKENMKCVLVLEERIPDSYKPKASGNNFLYNLMGADLRIVKKGTNMLEEMEKVSDELKAQGKNPYVIPGGGSNEIGTCGYINCANEIIEQVKTAELDIDYVVVASGSGGTHGGLLAGFRIAGISTPVLGMNVARDKQEQEDLIEELTKKTLKYLEVDKDISSDDVICFDDYLGPGYSLATDEMIEAVQLLARHEGILLDPVYTGKAMAGLIDLVRKNYFNTNDNVLFIHTGGSPALFENTDVVLKESNKK